MGHDGRIISGKAPSIIRRRSEGGGDPLHRRERADNRYTCLVRVPPPKRSACSRFVPWAVLPHSGDATLGDGTSVRLLTLMFANHTEQISVCIYRMRVSYSSTYRYGRKPSAVTKQTLRMHGGARPRPKAWANARCSKCKAYRPARAPY